MTRPRTWRIVVLHEPGGCGCLTRGRKETPAMQKILLAYDGGDPARRALDTASELARLTGASVAVVSVVPTHPGRFPVDPWDDTSVHAQELLDARRLLRERGIEAELIEPTGDPASTIERVAEEGGYDTVVIGSRGLNAMSRILQGSVSEHVATHAKATVVIAR
ncbi:MAG: universal stress protein UspA [Anaerolinea sp.]|nr:universal stress protein UspA [Anaerolinea sp.]